MKSNKIMRRQMGEYEVLQRTSDSYFDLNSLLQQWNNGNGNNRRRLDNICFVFLLFIIFNNIPINLLSCKRIEIKALQICGTSFI